MFSKIVILGLLTFVLAASAALGDTIQITPEDTYVEDFYPNTNFGKNGSYQVWEIYVGDENWNQNPVKCRSYLKFDLSAIPQGATITSAQIYLRCWGTGVTPFIVVGAYYLDNDSWDQYTITWNNQPTTGHSSSPTATNTIDNTGWYSWEVKSDLQDALDDDGVYSVVMREDQEATDHNWCGFCTEEEPWYPAYMTVTYTPASNPPVPDIKVNGQNISFSTPASTLLNITVSLNPGSQLGVAHDWWIFVDRNSTSFYWWKPSGMWVNSTTPVRTYNGGLFSLNNRPVASGKVPKGTWTFTFALDALNNIYEGTYLDSIAVTTY